MIYEDNFGNRYEKYEPMARSIDEFEGLNSHRYTFPSDQGQILVGYGYYRELENIKGLVIIAHGLGGGGHNSYMDVANFFTLNGYVVFAYDATGNDESEGSSVKGLPQGLIDLDYAIQVIDIENNSFIIYVDDIYTGIGRQAVLYNGEIICSIAAGRCWKSDMGQGGKAE